MTIHSVNLSAAGTQLDFSLHPGAGLEATNRPPILLLHPWFGCRQMWDPLVQHLDARSCAVDWYSIADHTSEAGWTPWASPHGLARAAVSTLDNWGVDRVDVIGNSVGGIVAQMLAADHPERVRRLVLIGTGASLGGPPTAFGDLVGRWIAEPGQRAQLVDQLVDALVSVPHPPVARESYVERIRAADPEFISAVLKAARGTDLRPRLKEITAPTLVLRGEHDTARTTDHVAELVHGIPQAEAVELAACGHSPMVEHPDRMAHLILDHLRS